MIEKIETKSYIIIINRFTGEKNTYNKQYYYFDIKTDTVKLKKYHDNTTFSLKLH